MILARSAVDVLGLIAIVGVCAALSYLAHRIEPHWVAKDRTRFITTAQELDQWATPVGRRREVRVRFDPASNGLLISRRSLVRPITGRWRITAKVPKPPRARAVYLLDLIDGETPSRATVPPGAKMALRVPAKSQVVPILDAMVATGSPPQPVTAPPDDG